MGHFAGKTPYRAFAHRCKGCAEWGATRMSASPRAKVEIAPLKAAVARVEGQTAVGSARTSEEWSQVPLALRERAFFSARLRQAHLAQKMLEMARASARLESVETDRGPVLMSKSVFVRESRKMLDAAGYTPDDPAWEGTLMDHRTKRRLDLIYDHNINQAREYARWQAGQDEGALDAFPAQELIREETREKPRKWRRRWVEEGGTLRGGRMVALKSDPIWAKLSRFDTPFPPFDFGSGMGVEDVGRDEAEELGLIKPGETPERADVGFNDALQASVEGLDQPVVDALVRSFNAVQEQVVLDGGLIRWKDQPGHQLSLLFKPESTSGSKQSVQALKEGLADLSRVVRMPTGPVIPMRETAQLSHSESEGEYWPHTSGEQRIDVLGPKLPSGKLAQAHEVGHFMDELLNGGNGYASEAWADEDVARVMDAISTTKMFEAAWRKDAIEKEKYWGESHELFARAFAQWQAEKSGDDLQIRLLRRRAKDFPFAAWSKEDFESVASAMDQLFEKRRLRR